jgi:transcriptional regulator with XRE-family HTH domain
VDNTALAQFLRARRALVQPADVGLATPGAAESRRRVTGLRREELALLAGVSVDYYVRLEQGRDHRPSESVLESLAQALQLNDELTAHLFDLAWPSASARATTRETVSELLQELLDSWSTTPATVSNSRMDLLAANALARELAPCYEPGTNLLRSLFLDPRSRDTHVNWSHAAAESVANFRARLGTRYADDSALTTLIGELSLHSQEFRELWARHDVHTTTVGRKAFWHPQVGRIDLRLHAMAVEDGQVLTVMHARPGSADADALALLSSLIAGHA